MVTRRIPYLLFTKYSSYLSRNVFIKTPQKKTFHSTVSMNLKMFMENENKYAYEVMLKNGYVSDLNVGENKIQSTKSEEFENFKNKNWSKLSNQNLFETFSWLCIYCSEQNISIADQRFDDYIDSLTDKIKFATDDELKLLFYCLSKFPQTESIKTRNFIEVWVALDDECFRRINSWTFDEMLSFLSLFYMLNITRASDFTYKCLLKLASKAKKLTKAQVIQTLFFVGTARKAPPDIHNLEVFIEENFLQYSVDELAVIAMGLFKSKTPIRSTTLTSNIIDKIIKESEQIHEISLASLLKIIRYSLKVCPDNKIYDLLNTLQYEIPRLSVMCNVHLALVGTSTLTLHENCLTKIAERIQASISSARIKDIERLILTYGTFNYIPKTNTCFFSQILEELRNPSRVEEIKKHGRSFACSIAYLGLLGIYPKDLINIVLSKEFLGDTYGKHCYQFGREILTIHNMAKIFLKDDNMNLLSEKQVVMLSKKFTDYIPSESFQKQYNVSERMFLDVNNVLQIMRGGKDFVTGHHIVTHHQRGGSYVFLPFLAPAYSGVRNSKFTLCLGTFKGRN